MTYVIGEPCIDVKNGACVDVCPVDCIYDVGRMMVIDPSECIDCAACEAECPVDAIFTEQDLPEEWADFRAINASRCGGLEDETRVLVERYASTHTLPSIEGRRQGG